MRLLRTNLKAYEYLYSSFDKSGEFDDEVYSGNKTETDKKMQLVLKWQKLQFTLFSFTDQMFKFIQTFNYTKAVELVNKHAS